MIPDDAIVVIKISEITVKEYDAGVSGVVMTAKTGFPGTLNPQALAHIYMTDNPHQDSIDNMGVPNGNNGKWFKLGGDGVVITNEEPIYPEEVHAPVSTDSLVKPDANGTAGTLGNIAAYPFCIADKLRLRGDMSERILAVIERTENGVPNDIVRDVSRKVPARMFYGTDAAGTVGFNPVPGEAIIP